MATHTAPHTVTGTVLSLTRSRSSVNGNPRFLVEIALENGAGIFTARTEPDAMLAYGIENREYREQLHVFTINGRGNITTAQGV